jgi:hypothetical protein
MKVLLARYAPTRSPYSRNENEKVNGHKEEPRLFAESVPSGGLTLIVGTQKWGVSCKVQRRTPADIILNESLPSKSPCGHHVHGRHGPMAMFSREKLLKIFKVSLKMQNIDPHFENLYLARKWVLKSSHWSCLSACFKGYTYCLTTFSITSPTGAQRSHERAPKKRSNDLERSRFRLCASLKTCDIQILEKL